LKSAELIGCNIVDKKMILPIRNEGEVFVEKFLRQNNINNSDKIVGFQVGASTISRMWFPERFIDLGKKLLNSYENIKIIITGSPEEFNYCKKIAQGIGKNAIVSAGKIPLRYIASLIKKCNVLVTGDTGIMHVAIAVGTPIIGLFAVSDPNKSGVYYDMDRHIIIKKDRICNPCKSKKCEYPKCMESISIDEVYKTMIKNFEVKL
ncbi:MAG: glycosyltransferase family 9 protein, partial [Candidatus Goldbacteria bacterium]|nr:glycosyltransferase family 9 protein [Candidatus Goldiibacteriota bacterium]